MNSNIFDNLNNLTKKLIKFWALLGGVILILLAFITLFSTLSNILFNAPINGDFEIIELGSMIVVFSFLPLCELQKGHIMVDFFTQKTPPSFKNATNIISTILMLVFALILFIRMSYGMLDYYDAISPETTMILAIPIWMTYIPALGSLLLLIIACLNNILQSAFNPNAIKLNVSDEIKYQMDQYS